MNFATAPLPSKLSTALLLLLPVDLRQACAQHTHQRGDLLFVQRKKPTHMFYISSGEVVLQRTSAQGDSFVLQRVRQGFVAEASLEATSYHCDAMVTCAGEHFSIPIELIRAALLNDAAFALRWISTLNQELKRLRAQCERLSLKGVRARLLHLIEAEGKNGRLALTTSVKSLASELAVTHEALYRTMTELENQGVLRRANGYLWV
jgi:CRP/FNR family transcriptional regulator, dissimilatory nitrate respiration regulator